jgi:hypothetical protein
LAPHRRIMMPSTTSPTAGMAEISTHTTISKSAPQPWFYRTLRA